MLKNKFFHLLIVLSFGFVTAYGIGLYLIQDKLIYYPDVYYTPPQGQLAVFQENIIPAEDGTPVRTWYFAGRKDKPAILFFHGNSGQIAKFATLLLPFTTQGYTVLMMEYRSFGGSAGSVGEKNFYKDSLTVYDWLKKQKYPQIIAYGYSLGTTMAVNVAAHRPVDKLILTAPFASMAKLVEDMPMPLARLLLKDTYDSEKMIKTINIPTLIIHGKNDKLIPYQHSEILFKASSAADKKIKLLENNNHMSIFFYGTNLPIIFDWLDRN